MMAEDLDEHGSPKLNYKLGGRSGKGFLPGQSGNPAGRPKKPTLKETIERILQEELPGKGMTKLEAIAHIWINEAMVKRDPRALNVLINRLYPTPRLRPEPAEQPQFQMKLIEFVTYRDGPGQDYYIDHPLDAIEEVAGRADPHPNFADYRGDYPEGHFPPEAPDDDAPPPNDVVAGPDLPAQPAPIADHTPPPPPEEPTASHNEPSTPADVESRSRNAPPPPRNAPPHSRNESSPPNDASPPYDADTT